MNIGVGLHVVVAITLTSALVAPALADEAPFSRRVSMALTVLPGDLLETISTVDVAIRSEVAVTAFGQITLQVNEHFANLEIIEATTVKADGRRIDVPADKILTSNLPNASQLGIFEADVRNRTIVFPDVAVGDSLHYKTHSRERQHGISGGFSATYVVPPSGRFENVEITLDAPKSLAVAEQSDGFARLSEEKGERRVVSWTLGPQTYQADEPGATAAIDHSPYLILSSYGSWQAIGQTFLDGAAPMSKPTADLKTLADDVTRGITDRRDQARAIFDWVSKNVRYFSIFLGQGGFVPHDAASVLANKYGDCKDHVTLMRALLAAKGIEADYALISTLPVYRAFEVPTPGWFNHVILWLPEFDHYVDPTASTSTFASLPGVETDKTVLRIGTKGIVVVRTPPLAAESNRLTVTADVTLAADGTAKGTATVAAQGATGASLRGVMTQVALKGGDVLAKELLGKQNWRGTGNIEVGPATDHSEPFVVKTTYDLSNKFFGDEGNRSAIPMGPRLLLPALNPFDQAIKGKHRQNFVCQAQSYDQIIDLHLPEGRTPTNIPASVNVSLPLASFEARYELNGQTLHIERRTVIRVPGQSCSPQIATDIAPVIAAATKEFGWRPQFARKDGSPGQNP
ncbi:DUF3857 and transglutaminase domain-containing protein [Bradyrhizobium sp. UFLA05-153]